MLPVVPGTRHVTLAGAIASDIHGKNHHRDGGIARHVASLSLCTPAGELPRGLARERPRAVLRDARRHGADGGGRLQATLAAEPLPSPWVADDIDRTDGLEQTLELMTADERHRYSVAWLDLLARGLEAGPRDREPLRSGARGADHERAGQRGARTRAAPPSASAPRARAGDAARAKRRDAFEACPRRLSRCVLLRPSGVRAFNALRWRAAPRRERGHALALAPYFFPLDVLGEWNRLYGAGGLIQYQFVVPVGQEAALMGCFELIRRRRLPVYLAVFKRLGAAFGGPLSFPLEGWTLAVDLPARAPGLGAALDELDELVAACGGRVYLTKDVRLRREVLRAMYPAARALRGSASACRSRGRAALGPRAPARALRGAAVSAARPARPAGA